MAFPRLLPHFQKTNPPLIIKHVKPLNITAVLALPAHDPEALAFLNRLAPYLWDPALYTASVPAEPKLLSTAFTSEEERLMFNHKFHLHNGPVRGCVYGFKAAQYFKGCTRPVWDCRIKEAFTDILPHYHLQTQTAISKQLHAIASSILLFGLFRLNALACTLYSPAL